MSPNKRKYFPRCLQVCLHHKLEWKEHWFEWEYALNHITLQNWTSRHMSQLWNIGGLFCQVELCQIHVAKLPTPCHQGYSANFVNSTSYCGLPDCSPNCTKWTSLQVAHCLGWFCSLSVNFGHNNNNNSNNNLQFSVIQKKRSYCASELHSYVWHGRHAYYKICGKFQKVFS
jgi:hypothetical protein